MISRLSHRSWMLYMIAVTFGEREQYRYMFFQQESIVYDSILEQSDFLA